MKLDKGKEEGEHKSEGTHDNTIFAINADFLLQNSFVKPYYFWRPCYFAGKREHCFLVRWWQCFKVDVSIRRAIFWLVHQNLIANDIPSALSATHHYLEKCRVFLGHVSTNSNLEAVIHSLLTIFAHNNDYYCSLFLKR